MHILFRIIGMLVSGLIAFVAYILHKQAIKNGHYVKGWYGKTTIWRYVCYFAIVLFAICVFSFFDV